MNSLFLSLGAGRWSLNTLKGVIAAWLIGEVLAFCLAVKLLGLGLTLLAMFGTSLLGFAILRRVGMGAAQHLRRAMASGGAANAAFVDGTLTAVGAVLLILPGFVSDVAGLVLATPSLRQTLAARFLAPGAAPERTARSRSPDVIDLAPEDWRVVDKSGRV